VVRSRTRGDRGVDDDDVNDDDDDGDADYEYDAEQMVLVDIPIFYNRIHRETT
jgi:hypothetical protein